MALELGYKASRDKGLSEANLLTAAMAALRGEQPGSAKALDVAQLCATLHTNNLILFMTFLETSSLENYHEFEVSRYKTFSKCSTHGYYIWGKYCIFKHRIRGSFRDLKFPRKSGKG